MSMAMYTIIQTISIFAAYMVTVLVLPAMVLYKRLKSRRIAERVVFYFLAGNMYVVNLVLYLGLLKIHNRWTLLLGTVIPLYLVATRLNHVAPQRAFQGFFTRFRRLFMGIFGGRNALYRAWKMFKEYLHRWIPALWRVIWRHFFEWILLACLLAAVFWVFGEQLVTRFGYCASDIPVHNMWVNHMTEHDSNSGYPFAAGVYPFGFHCIVYYLHEVFGFDTYVVFRVFYICQTFLIYFMLAMFIKLSCKTNYLGYVAAIAALVYNGFVAGTHQRYGSSLPQEHGMIYILPGIYFLFQFFNERRKEIRKKEKELQLLARGELSDDKSEEDMDPELRRQRELQKLREPEVSKSKRKDIRKEKRLRRREARRRKEKKFGRWKKWRVYRKETKLSFRETKISWYCLFGFCMSFSLSLSVHFYDTMIAGIFVAAVGMAFVFWIFRRYYFWSVLIAGLLSVFLAVAPMAVAVAGGTPLQGSLGWGLSILTGKKVDVSGNNSSKDKKEKNEEGETQTPSSSEELQSSETELSEKQEQNPEMEKEQEVKEVVHRPSLKERIQNGRQAMVEKVGSIVFSKESAPEVLPWVFLSIGILLIFGVFFWLLRQWFYGSRMISCALYVGMLLILIAANQFGIPALMAPDRFAIFIAYSITIPAAFIADGACFLIGKLFRRKWISQVLSLLLSAAILVYGTTKGYVCQPILLNPQQTNSAITCLTNIISQNKDFSYTIISASDERNLAYDHSYHTELITFLRAMEYYDSDTKYTIPSEKIYIFVEKIPVQFGLRAQKKGQRISHTDANQMLSFSAGIVPYQGDERWNTMARAYYWAEAFQHMYPDETSVYYETDEFICFEIRQNPYREFNLAIDYGYNSIDWSSVRSEKW